VTQCYYRPRDVGMLNHRSGGLGRRPFPCRAREYSLLKLDMAFRNKPVEPMSSLLTRSSISSGPTFCHLIERTAETDACLRVGNIA
jgi:hypothetical protein